MNVGDKVRVKPEHDIQLIMYGVPSPEGIVKKVSKHSVTLEEVDRLATQVRHPIEVVHEHVHSTEGPYAVRTRMATTTVDYMPYELELVPELKLDEPSSSQDWDTTEHGSPSGVI